MSVRARIRTSELCAVDILCRQKELSIHAMAHLDVRRLDTGFDITYDTFQGYFSAIGGPLPEKLPDGMTLSNGGRYVVLCDASVESAGRRNFSYAHELGHIVLGHTHKCEAFEREADAFAASLLMPSAAVMYLAKLHGTSASAELIASSFNVSRKAASMRADDIASRIKRSTSLHESEMMLLLKLFGKVTASETKKQL